MDTIGVVLSLHKRSHGFENQIKCLLDQTKKIDEIFVWLSQSDHLKLIEDIEEKYSIKITHGCSNVPGVWGRFSFALNLNTDFIYIMDDDVFPGKKYLERCVYEFYENEGCIISPSGLRFYSTPRSFVGYERFGWNSYPKDETENHEVHYGQHGWFFHRDFLPYFWRELPKESYSKYAGEDMHFSHMISKYTEHKTIVLSHHSDDLDSFSNDPRNEGFDYGNDTNGIAYNRGLKEMEYILLDKVKNGWQI